MHNCKETLTRTGVTFDEGKIVQEFFVCSECGKRYTTINGKLSKVVAPQPSEALKEAEEKKAAQREKAKKYRLEREARIKAQKEKERADLMNFIKSTPADRGVATVGEKAPVVIVTAAASSAPKKKAAAPKQKGTLTDEEKKLRARAWSKAYRDRKKQAK